MTQIKIENLSYSYPGSKDKVLKQIHLEIEKGEFLAIVGNNGCGKSTLCKVLNGLIPHFIPGNFEGSALIDGQDTKMVDVGILSKVVGYVYQDFENQIVRPTVLDDASYACLNYGMEDYLKKGREALSMCGLNDKEADYVFQLSGGQLHLLALAGAVALGPDILILDEPIAQLNPAHAMIIYEVLKKLNREYNKTIIVIEHHTEYIAEYCSHVILMDAGKIKWKLPVKDAMVRVEELKRSNVYPPQVTQAAFRLKELGIYPWNKNLPITAIEAVISFCALLPEKERLKVQITKKEQNSTECIRFEQVEVTYRSVKGEAKTIFDKLTIKIHAGEHIALIGTNGAGKSTFMKLLTGLIKPKSGDVYINGRATRKLKTEDLAREIAYVYQNPEEMFIKDSIRNDIAYAMQVRNVEQWERKTEELLEKFHLSSLAERDGRLLSGGQMRRASLAIGIALNPSILLLDEPTANLDIATRKEIMRTLTEMKEVTDTVLIATHDMQLVSEWADRIIVLSNGKVVADGSRESIFSDEMLLKKTGIQPPEIYQVAKQMNQSLECFNLDEFYDLFLEEVV